MFHTFAHTKITYQNPQIFLGLIKIEKTATRTYAFLTGFTPCKVEQSLQDMHSQVKVGNRRGKAYIEEKDNICLFILGLK